MLPVTVAHTYNTSILEADPGGLRPVSDQPGLQHKFKVSQNSKSLSQIRPKQQQKTETEQKFPKIYESTFLGYWDVLMR